MANNKLAFNPLTGGFDLVTDVSAIEGDISGIAQDVADIQNADKILYLHAYEDNTLVYDGAQPGVVDPLLNPLGQSYRRDGWYYQNSTGQSISWYFFDGSTQATIQKQNFNAYTVITLDSLGAKPIIGIYSFPTGSGDVLPGFAHSRWSYQISNANLATMTIGKKYLLYVGENPTTHSEIPHIPLDYIAAASGGSQLPTELVSTSALISDGAEPAGDVKWMVESMGVWSTSYKHEIKLRIKELLKSEFAASQELVKEPTGFATRSTSTLSFNNATRQFTIAPTGASFDVYIKGNKYTKTSTSLTIPAVSGNHYIYFTSAGVLTSTTVLSDSLFSDNALVSIIYWNTTQNARSYFAEERHGLVMDGATHGYLHTVFGARYLTGLALQGFVVDGDGTLDTQAQFQADSGTIRDEDIVISLSLTSNIPVLFREGTQWRKKAADAFPVVYNGTVGYTGTRIAYNQLVGASWQLTEVNNNDFVLVHVFATNDIETPFVAILGINQYPTIPQARAAADSEISSLSGLPFAEFVAVGTVIFQTNSAYTNTPKVIVRSASVGENYVDFRGEQLYTPSGVATSHSLLSNLSNDDHLQYYNESRGDARYVLKTGDTMSGPLIVDDGAGTNTLDIEGTHIAAGDIFTEYARMGYFMNLAPTPTYQKYSDGGIGYLSLGENDSSTGVGKMIDLQLTGIKMTETTDNGVTNTPIMPTLPEHVVVKKYVDDAIAGIPGSSGEANTASNVGTGDGVFKQKTGVDLEFKSLKSGAGITLTPSASEIEISSPLVETSVSYLPGSAFAGQPATIVPQIPWQSPTRETILSIFVNSFCTSFSPDAESEYLAAGQAATPWILLFKKAGDIYTQLGNPATIPTTTVTDVAWSLDSQFLAVTSGASPFIFFYQRSGHTFTKLANPASLPAAGTVPNAVVWSPSSEFVVIAANTTPFIHIYSRSNTTFTKVANPSVLPTVALDCVDYCPVEDLVVLGSALSPKLYTYTKAIGSNAFLNVTGNFSVTPAGTINSIKFNPKGDLLAIGHSSAPYISIYQRSGTTFTKLPDLANLPTATVVSVAWSYTGQNLIVSQGASEFIMYSVSGTTFTKLPAISPSFTGGLGFSFSRNGKYVSYAKGSSSIGVFKTSGSIPANSLLKLP